MATDIFGRGIDVERVNVVINYVSPSFSVILHMLTDRTHPPMLIHTSTESVELVDSVPRDWVCFPLIPERNVGIADNVAISFVSSEPDQEVLQKIQERFTVAIPTLPDTIDPATYSTFIHFLSETRAD